jgi:hypothetical protein
LALRQGLPTTQGDVWDLYIPKQANEQTMEAFFALHPSLTVTEKDALRSAWVLVATADFEFRKERIPWITRPTCRSCSTIHPPARWTASVTGAQPATCSSL